MISVIDYGMGNTASIINMIRKAGGEGFACKSPEELAGASAVLLPGIGAFDNGMMKLTNSGFLDALSRKVLNDKVPFLGICLGMQLLFDKSEEGELPGLGWLSGNVTKFDFSSDIERRSLKVPHMGWNTVTPTERSPLYLGLENEARFYFAHSYHVNCHDPSDVLTTAHHGYDFTCSVHRKNIWGSQFHPEKSHRFGVQFFKNFLQVVQRA